MKGAVKRKRRVLIADESITIQKLVHLTLTAPQFEVIASSDGQDAHQKAKSLKPDLILADCNLRQVDGFDLVEKIRGDSTLTSMRTVLLKGNLHKAKEKYLANCPADEILQKPFDSKSLLDLVHKLLLDEESTVVGLEKPQASSTMDEDKTPIVKLAPKNKMEVLNQRLEAIAEEVAPKKVAELSSLDEDTAKVLPQNFKQPVNSVAPTTLPNGSHPQAAPAEEEMQAIVRDEVRKWVQENLPRLAEDALKKEISKLTSK